MYHSNDEIKAFLGLRLYFPIVGPHFWFHVYSIGVQDTLGNENYFEDLDQNFWNFLIIKY